MQRGTAADVSRHGFAQSHEDKTMNDVTGDPLYPQALAVTLAGRRLSASLLQRRFLIGFNRATCLLETMRATGVESALEDLRTNDGPQARGREITEDERLRLQKTWGDAMKRVPGSASSDDFRRWLSDFLEDRRITEARRAACQAAQRKAILEDEELMGLPKIWTDAARPMLNIQLPGDFRRWVLHFLEELLCCETINVDEDDLRDCLGRGDRAWGGSRVVAPPDMDVANAVSEMLLPLRNVILPGIRGAILMCLVGPGMNLGCRDIISRPIASLRSFVSEDCRILWGYLYERLPFVQVFCMF
jgi:hypothetical protein